MEGVDFAEVNVHDGNAKFVQGRRQIEHKTVRGNLLWINLHGSSLMVEIQGGCHPVQESVLSICGCVKNLPCNVVEFPLNHILHHAERALRVQNKSMVSGLGAGKVGHCHVRLKRRESEPGS